jgi:hypothetical protein
MEPAVAHRRWRARGDGRARLSVLAMSGLVSDAQ